MKHDDLSWLCAELDLPVLEETAGGLLANNAAKVALPGAELSIAAAAAAIMGLDERTLCDAMDSARRGERHTAVLGPNAGGRCFRVLAAPITRDGSRIRLALAPADVTPVCDGLTDVAAAVSHEVANAVGTIRGWADLALHKSDATVDMRDALTLIHAAARSAEQAARSMLALARGEAHADEERPLDLSEFTAELLQLLTLSAREARVTLESSIEPALFVRASRAQLFTIVFNLIKNAIEACKPGGLVSVQAKGDPRGARLVVRDTGEGFDSSAKERLFERYYTTKANGTGLGLALVRSAAQACGAELEVESEKGRGTVFRITFQRSCEVIEPDPGWGEPRSTSHRERQPLDTHVLVVDDDHALREMLVTALALRGAHVTSVRSSEEALRLEGPFEIALIDMMLDGCRGDELLALLRQRGVVNAAMLVTGTVQKPRLVPGGEPDDWVRKPFEISHLVDRIRRTLDRHRMLDAASSTARA